MAASLNEQEIGFLTWTQASKYSGMSEMSLRRMVSEGKLTIFKPLPRKALICREELTAAIKACAKPTAATE